MSNLKPINKKSLFVPSLSLFTSFGTLICCALPALMVSIGAGAALAGVLSSFPHLIWLSQYKVTVFAVAGVLLGLAGFVNWKNRLAPCPTNPTQAKACAQLRKISWILLWISLAIYCVGFFFAFFAAKVLL